MAWCNSSNSTRVLWRKFFARPRANRSVLSQLFTGFIFVIFCVPVTWIFFGPVAGFHHMIRYGVTFYLMLNGEDPQPGDYMWGEYAVYFFPVRFAIGFGFWLVCITVILFLVRFFASTPISEPAVLFSHFRTEARLIKDFYLPSVRGWIAIALSVFARLVYPMILPPRDVYEWKLYGKVSAAAWILGVLAIILCFSACLEAIKRGSPNDKAVALIGGLITFSLVALFVQLFFMQLQPNR